MTLVGFFDLLGVSRRIFEAGLLFVLAVYWLAPDLRKEGALCPRWPPKAAKPPAIDARLRGPRGVWRFASFVDKEIPKVSDKLVVARVKATPIKYRDCIFYSVRETRKKWVRPKSGPP